MKKIRIASRTILLIFIGMVTIPYSQEMNALAQLIFPSRAKFAMMERDGIIKGYKLMGHTFNYPGYFNGSATAVDSDDYGDCTLSKSGSGNTSSSLFVQASCLNPIISLEETHVQIDRVAKARGLKTQQVRNIVDTQAGESWGVLLGETKVNVRGINIALDDTKREYISRPTNHEGRIRK